MTDVPTSAHRAPEATPGETTSIATSNDLLQICAVCRHEFLAPAHLLAKRKPCAHCGALVTISAGDRKPDILVGKKIGNCRLSYRLGSGGIGLVYAADQLSVGRKVAIKMLGAKAGANQVLVSRFQRESQLAAQINHLNVVHVYDCGFDRGVHFQIMELVEGGTLASLIEEDGRLPWREACDFALQLCRALELMHRMDIIHRDIKPANILIGVDDKGRIIAKLSDLGLAKQIDGDNGANGLTLEGKPLGSPSFMPPEQVKDGKSATVRSDIYGLGASLYMMITGIRPFDGQTAYEIMSRVLTAKLVPPAALVEGLPPALNDLIVRCLNRDPAQRPAQASELEALIGEILALNPDTSPPSVKGTPVWKRPATAGGTSAQAANDNTPPTFLNSQVKSGPRSSTAKWERPTTPGTLPTADPSASAVPGTAAGTTAPARSSKATDSSGSGLAPPAPASRWLIGTIVVMGVVIIGMLVLLLLR
jgi:serine/threonine-protein kinase